MTDLPVTASTFQRRVLAWYDQHGRKDLPWQQDITPYRVWVSEIMLQQTQVSTVIPFFQRFMDSFPTVTALAAADEDRVLHHWTGLGYYARARNLHKAARQVVREHDGQFPRDLDALQSLPGIGRSTAGAIASLSMDLRGPILDGNVKRVLTRFCAVHGWPGERAVEQRLWQVAEAYTPRRRLREYTQVMMDLGATVCTPRQPRCGHCPLAAHCRAHALGCETALPTPKPRKVMPVRQTVMLLLCDDAGRVLLEQRPDSGLWGGLWCFPELPALPQLPEWLQQQGWQADPAHALPGFRHTFSHYHLDVTPLRVPLRSPGPTDDDTRRWVHPHAPGELGLAAPVKRLLQELSGPWQPGML